MYRLIILFSLIIIGIGCGAFQSDSVHVPDNMELDLDQDGNTDFTITYLQRTEGDPAGNYQVVRLNLESNGGSQVLKQEETQPIFLAKTEEIQTIVSPPLYWEVTNPASGRTTPLALIRTDYDETTWNDQWTIFSLEEKEFYLMAFKLDDNGTTQLGFFEFSIDLESGEFSLLKTELL